MCSTPYSARPCSRQLAANKLDIIPKAHIVEPATAKRVSSFDFAWKNGSIQFCVDCRIWNAVGFRVAYPLRWINEFIDSFGEVRTISTFAAYYGDRKVEINELERRRPRLPVILACTTRHGSFLEWKTRQPPSNQQRKVCFALWKDCSLSSTQTIPSPFRKLRSTFSTILNVSLHKCEALE